MALTWFRYHADALDNPRVQKLPGDLFKIWVNLQCILALEKAAAHGKLPPLDECAYRLRLPLADTEKALDNLVDKGLLKVKSETECNDFGNESETECNGKVPQNSLEIFPTKKIYFLRNWEKKQYKSDVSTERVKRFRNAKRNGNETPPDQIRSDTEQIRSEGPDLLNVNNRKKVTGNAVAAKTYGGPYDILRHLTDDQIDNLRYKAHGWDIQNLAAKYNAQIEGGRFDPPKAPYNAFVAWIQAFTKGQKP